MTYRPTLRVVNPDGTIGEILADAKNVAYLDDSEDIGVINFEYPRNGVHADLIKPMTEIALFVNGKELRNSRGLIDEHDGNRVSDSLPVIRWSAQTLLGRFEEAIVLPEKDTHLREDVRTKAELRALERAREEWMDSATQKAIREAKAEAKSYRESQQPDPDRSGGGGGKKGGGPPIDTDVSGRRARAIRWANNQISNPSQNWYRMCQSFVRQSFGLPGIYGTASEAWFAGPKRPNTPVAEIPAGVPVYWGPNHVALSIGDGWCISTDVLRNGQVDKVPTASLHNGVHWNLSYRGWSPEVSGVTIFP